LKRHKNLYDDVCDFENLLLSARKAQQGKRGNPRVQTFNHRIETELLTLQEELQAQTYRPGAYRTFTINDPKTRMISAAPFRDRVVHHALCNIVEPIFERVFIHDSYACRKGKGTHAAVDRFTQFMHSNEYVLKCDIKKYFASIDHEILKQLIRRKIGCPRTLWLIDLIIDHSNPQEFVDDYFPSDNLFTPSSRRKGLPLGNQTSQFFANIYLDPLDHFVKEKLGCRAFIRYVDDFVVLEQDISRMWEVHRAIEAFLHERLRLNLHPRKQFVTPVRVGIDFLGYRVFPAHRLLRRSSGYRFARRLRTMQQQYRSGVLSPASVQQRIASWVGHAKHADTYGLRTALFSQAVFCRA